ncbi:MULTISPECIES: hypothetical protein [unclassified Lentimicrobium]|uniref:hypothetical protein n=1 Tax=unclassified Lentimicrobium TaxID=2677434 RepID=UPI0015534E5D|nr:MULTISPECIES: hypothetical protein [unclassified Lentimicrobium]NPD45915.1 hypothetical protein [Lentimicrobium sp. S6]NPD85924.1 hypothetical protein [Lentimicrobium sp. L6]
MTKTKILSIFFILLLGLSFFNCKSDKLKENIDPNEVNFLVTQPSIATATFVAKCTNYDIVLDSVTILSPNSAVYFQDFNSRLLSQNEEQLIGGYESFDGLWIIRFNGKVQNSERSYSVSIPYEMNIEEDDDE